MVLFDDTLVVSGERRLPAAGPHGIYHVADVRQGPFRLELPIPADDRTEHVDARSDRGLLQITLPKAAAR